MIEILAQATPGPSEAMQILQSVHQFYNDAWTSLLWAVGVGAAVLIGLVGVILPWWTERSRRESFRLDKEAVLKEIVSAREDMARLIDNETRMYKDNLRDAIRQLDEGLEAAKKLIEAQAGDLWWAHSRQAKSLGEKEVSVAFSTLSIKSYLNAGDEESRKKVAGSLDEMAKVCASIDPKHNPKGLEIAREMVSGVLQAVERAGSCESYSKPIEVIKTFLATAQVGQQSGDLAGQSGER